MKLPDLRKALRADAIGPDCSVYAFKATWKEVFGVR